MQLDTPQNDCLRILIVEDNAAEVLLLKRGLKEANPAIEVEAAHDAETAAEMISKSPPDYYGLVLLDLNLPRKSGLSLLADLRAEAWLHNIAVIVLTSSRLPDDIGNARTLRADGYILKPSDLTGYRKIGTFINSCWFGDGEIQRGEDGITIFY